MTPEPAPKPAQLRLDAIRARRSLAAESFGIVADSAGMRLVAGPGSDAPTVALLPSDAPYDDREFLLHLVEDFDWLLLKFDALSARYRAALKEIDRLSPKPKDFAAECAMKCDDPVFRRFLAAEHDVDAADRERIATRLRTILGIASRAELNTDEAARRRWLALRDRFDAWKRRQRHG